MVNSPKVSKVSNKLSQENDQSVDRKDMLECLVKRWLNHEACLKWILSYTKSSFSGDVLKLVGGTAFAQVLSILASPIITRMYGPEAYGLSALFTSIAGIIATIACLRYELAVMLPEKDEDAANLLALSLILATLISAVTAFVFWLRGEKLLGFSMQEISAH